MTANAPTTGRRPASNGESNNARTPVTALGGEGSMKEFKGRILHLFSGPKHREDGFAAALQARGWLCDEYDIVNGQEEDLASDHVWCYLLEKIRQGYYAALLAGPPCNSFSNARKETEAHHH